VSGKRSRERASASPPSRGHVAKVAAPRGFIGRSECYEINRPLAGQEIEPRKAISRSRWGGSINCESLDRSRMGPSDLEFDFREVATAFKHRWRESGMSRGSHAAQFPLPSWIFGEHLETDASRLSRSAKDLIRSARPEDFKAFPRSVILRTISRLLAREVGVRCRRRPGWNWIPVYPFLRTPSRKVLPAGPAQVTIKGRWPILSDFSRRQVDGDGDFSSIVCRTDRTRAHCARARVRELQKCRDETAARLAAFWRACSESRLVNVPSPMSDDRKKKVASGCGSSGRTVRPRKRRATAITDNMLICGCLSRWPATNSFPLSLKTFSGPFPRSCRGASE
jgi:hypothetical protein